VEAMLLDSGTGEFCFLMLVSWCPSGEVEVCFVNGGVWRKLYALEKRQRSKLQIALATVEQHFKSRATFTATLSEGDK
jgi:hypothetical protein